MPMPLSEYDVAMFGEAREDRLSERPLGVGKSRSAIKVQKDLPRVLSNCHLPEAVAFNAP